MADRGAQDVEVGLENRWAELRAEVTLTLMTSPGDPATTDTPRWMPAADSPLSPVTLLLDPGQSARFRLPAGWWQVRRRAWIAVEPYPERRTEWPPLELQARRRYKAQLDSDEERSLREALLSEALDEQEQRARRDPLMDLGRPAPTPDAFGWRPAKRR